MSHRAVYKSRAAEFLDRRFGGDSDDLRLAYDQAEANLRTTEDGLRRIIERLEQDRILVEDIGVEHFEQFWLSDAGPMAGQEAGRLLRSGYAKAIEIARRGPDEDPLPIETLWVKGVSDDFEVHICEADRHVTVILFIPTNREYGSEEANSKSWIVRLARDGVPKNGVRLDDQYPPVVAIQTSGRQESRLS